MLAHQHKKENKEKEDLREGGMPDFIINRITPAIDIMKFFITANNPKWQAVGVEGSDADIAHIHSNHCHKELSLHQQLRCFKHLFRKQL